MKKILAFILAGAIALTLASCDVVKPVSDDTVAEETAADETTVAEETTEEETTAEEDTSEDETPGYDFSKGLDENGFFAGVKASELVTLPTYNGAEMDISYTVASEEEIQKQIDGVVGETNYEQITDRAVANGDTVNIDYVGSVDGVEFDGGSTGGAGTVVTIGVTNYIDDFLDQLIGHMPGETFNVEVTFPEDYGNEELNGKDAVFVTTVNYVCGEKLPSVLTDEIAEQYGFDSKEALVNDIEAWIIENQKYSFAEKVLTSAVCENIPDEIVEYFVNAEMAQLESSVAMYGMTVEDYLSMSGYESVEAYREASVEYHKANAVKYLAVQAIAEAEKITVTEDDIAAAGITDADIEAYGEPYIKQYILASLLVPEFIINNSVLAETSAEQ